MPQQPTFDAPSYDELDGFDPYRPTDEPDHIHPSQTMPGFQTAPRQGPSSSPAVNPAASDSPFGSPFSDPFGFAPPPVEPRK